MNFYWKFTRQGNTSSKYISLVIDCHDSNIVEVDNRSYLSLDEECYKTILLLMQEIELRNNPYTWHSKDAFIRPIIKLGYKPSSRFTSTLGSAFKVDGKKALGLHPGTPLEYGEFVSSGKSQKIYIDLSLLRVGVFINAKTGKLYNFPDDKLEPYRLSRNFINDGNYYDLMPVHDVIYHIFTSLNAVNSLGTGNFVTKVLRWDPIS